MMNVFLQSLHLEADHLAYWIDEALHNPIVSEDEFLSKMERYAHVLRQIKRICNAQRPVPGIA